MNLTTLARVQAVIGDTSATLDAILNQWIADLSAEVERALGRGTESVARVEHFSPWRGQRIFPLLGYPIASITHVKEDTSDRTFTDASSSTLPTDVYVADSQLGHLVVHSWELVGGPKSLEVSYVGGMAADTAGFVAAFPDIAGAMDLQVAFWLKRRNTLAESATTVAGATTTTHNPVEWLPQLRSAVARHRRLLVA